jgi:phytoene dehydrogenase-like protein
MQSYIIVGGGLAGLTAANALAQPDRKVTLLEQSEHLGGRAATRQEAGFFLNLGPHALYRGGPAMRTFKEWNIPFEGHLPAQDKTHLVYQGKKFPLIASTASLLTSPLLGVAEKLEAGNLFRLLAAGKAPKQSMRDWIEDHARSPKVRGLAAALTRLTTFTADHDHLSATAALQQLALAFAHNVEFLDHGWQTLIDGLSARARSLGVEIRCNAPLESIAFRDADGIILAVPPAAVETFTGVRFPNLRPVRVAVLDLGLGALPENAANFGLGIDQPLYYSVHSAAAKLAPEGSALIQMAKYLAFDTNPGSDPARDRADLEQFADLLAPGWRDRVTVSRFLPNMTVSHAMATTEGRPDVDVLNKEAVAICGDWVGPENMLTDAAVSSALRAAAVVQKKSARNAA